MKKKKKKTILRICDIRERQYLKSNFLFLNFQLFFSALFRLKMLNEKKIEDNFMLGGKNVAVQMYLCMNM